MIHKKSPTRETRKVRADNSSNALSNLKGDGSKGSPGYKIGNDKTPKGGIFGDKGNAKNGEDSGKF